MIKPLHTQPNRGELSHCIINNWRDAILYHRASDAERIKHVALSYVTGCIKWDQAKHKIEKI